LTPYTARGKRARREGRPPYALFANRQVFDLTRTRPATLAELLEIDGIGLPPGHVLVVLYLCC